LKIMYMFTTLLLLMGCRQESMDDARKLWYQNDYKAASEILIKLGENNDIAALTELGILYETEGFKQPEKAFSAFKAAADLGGVYANRAIGGAYEKGEGVKKNPGYAEKYYLVAATLGDSFSMATLANLYRNELRFKDPKGDLCAEWNLKSWEHGDKYGGINMILSSRGYGKAWILALHSLSEKEDGGKVVKPPVVTFKDDTEFLEIHSYKIMLLKRYNTQEPAVLLPWRKTWKKLDSTTI
jgi:TPR repeat protein